jgi:hypothetical protein
MAESLPRLMTKAWYNTLHAWLLLWPQTLAADWACTSVANVVELEDPRNLGSLLLLAGLAGSLLYCAIDPSSTAEHAEAAAGRRAAFLALALLVVPFLPAAHFLLDVGYVVAERLLYLPSAGFCLLAALAIGRAADALLAPATAQARQPPQPRQSTGASRGLAAAAVAVLIAVYTARTLQRNPEWRSESTLYQAGLRALPTNCKMHYNYATTMAPTPGNVHERMQHFERAIALYPKYTEAYTNFGALLAQSGRISPGRVCHYVPISTERAQRYIRS